MKILTNFSKPDSYGLKNRVLLKVKPCFYSLVDLWFAHISFSSLEFSHLVKYWSQGFYGFLVNLKLHFIGCYRCRIW